MLFSKNWFYALGGNTLATSLPFVSYQPLLDAARPGEEDDPAYIAEVPTPIFFKAHAKCTSQPSSLTCCDYQVPSVFIVFPTGDFDLSVFVDSLPRVNVWNGDSTGTCSKAPFQEAGCTIKLIKSAESDGLTWRDWSGVFDPICGNQDAITWTAIESLDERPEAETSLCYWSGSSPVNRDNAIVVDNDCVNRLVDFMLALNEKYGQDYPNGHPCTSHDAAEGISPWYYDIFVAFDHQETARIDTRAIESGCTFELVAEKTATATCHARTAFAPVPNKVRPAQFRRQGGFRA